LFKLWKNLSISSLESNAQKMSSTYRQSMWGEHPILLTLSTNQFINTSGIRDAIGEPIANLENLKKFQGFLSRLKRKGALGENVYNEIRPTAAVTPTLYGLPKVHKDNIPLRPILCSIDSFTDQCASWLSKSLSDLSRHPSTAKDTFEFLRITDHELDRNRMMCSFDVKSLFTNIPVDFTVNLMLDKVFADADKENKFHGLNRTELRKMLNFERC